MTEEKRCFMDAERPCNLSCKAAFEVDDPVDNVDCYFIWLAHHFGEGLFELRRLMDGFGGGGFAPPSFGSGGPGPGPASPKGPKGFPEN